MTTLQAIALGALQGVTEFLPVSSSGHLLVMKELFGVSDVPVLFDVLLHVATLVAVVIVLRQRVWALLVAFGHLLSGRTQESDRPYTRLIPMIIVTTVVTGVVGVGLDTLLEVRTTIVTSALFLVTALLLLTTMTARGSRNLSAVTWRDAFMLGAAQGVGALPGISRSGITITAALHGGLDRKTAGEYSFLISIPAILGALVLELRNLGSLGSQISPIALVVGCATAAVVGYLSMKALLKVVQAGRLYLFALYLVPLGVWGLFYFT